MIPILHLILLSTSFLSCIRFTLNNLPYVIHRICRTYRPFCSSIPYKFIVNPNISQTPAMQIGVSRNHSKCDISPVLASYIMHTLYQPSNFQETRRQRKCSNFRHFALSCCGTARWADTKAIGECVY